MSNPVAAFRIATLIALCTTASAQAMGTTPKAKSDVSNCLINLTAVHSPVRFTDFPARPGSGQRWRGPVLAAPDAVEFRTMLRKATLAPPNFAGHYAIAVWGCGASCTDFGLIDRQTGRVFFDNSLRAIAGDHVGNEPNGEVPTFNSLRFRPDSRLLVVLGAPNEDQSREGVTFLQWTGAKLVQLRFVRETEACTSYP